MKVVGNRVKIDTRIIGLVSIVSFGIIRTCGELGESSVCSEPPPDIIVVSRLYIMYAWWELRCGREVCPV